MKTITKFTTAAMAFLLISCAYTTSQAQETETTSGAANHTIFGLKGGANLTNLYVDDVNDENPKLGFQAGFFAKAALSKNFAIQPELLYSQKGARFEDPDFFGEGKTTVKLHYIELPVMAVINIGALNIHAGPYVSYLAGVNVKRKNDNGSTSERELDKDNFESFDYGVAGGLGIDGNGVGFGLRYNYGLKEIGKEQSIGGVEYRLTGAKNSVLQAYLTFGF